MTNTDFQITTILECEDEIDREINDNTVAMIMGLRVNSSVLHNQNLWDKYFSSVVEVATSLQKANLHRRKYIESEVKFIADYKEKFANSNQNTHSSTTAIPLTAELDAFLTHFKSALDSLSKTFNPLFSTQISVWKKYKNKTTGTYKSGQQIVYKLIDSPDYSDKVIPLITFIEENFDWLTYHVKLRDDVNHNGGIKCISNVIYNCKTKDVIPQHITHPGNKTELVRAYMNRMMEEMIHFIGHVLILSLEAKALGNDMLIQKNTESEFPPYNWMIKLPK